MQRKSYQIVFLVNTTLTAVVFWWFADWWAYVDDPQFGPWRKFIMPWWWQVGVSLLVGSFVGAAVVAGAFCLMKLWKLARRRRSALP